MPPDDCKDILKNSRCLLKDGDFAAVRQNCEEICAHDPDNAEAWLLAGIANMNLGRQDAAIECLEHHVRLRPTNTKANRLLGSLYQAIGKLDTAISRLNNALSIQPHNTEIMVAMGLLFEQSGNPGEAARIYQQAIQTNPSLLVAIIRLGSVALDLGNPGEARKYCDKALAMSHENINAVALKIRLLERTGQPDKAWKLAKTMLEKNQNHEGILSIFSRLSQQYGHEKEAINLVENTLTGNNKITVNQQRHLHFDLGRLYDNVADYKNAFMHFSHGNTLRKARYDTKRLLSDIKSLIDYFSVDCLAALPTATILTDKPIFIIGMPRSGTTLVEQILASHSEVQAGGEQPHMTRLVSKLQQAIGNESRYPYWLARLDKRVLNECTSQYITYLDEQSPGSSRITDKTPNNYIHLGLIQCLLPKAKIIHVRRDPRDTCLSIYFQDFVQGHQWAYDLENIGEIYSGYRKIMQHWENTLSISILDIKYEELVNNFETTVRSITDFCSLPWDKNCLQFHTQSRFVNTASYNQVSQPIYKSSIGRWKHYEQHIKPLTEILDQFTES